MYIVYNCNIYKTMLPHIMEYTRIVDENLKTMCVIIPVHSKYKSKESTSVHIEI